MGSIDDTKSRMQHGPALPRPLGTAYLLVVANESSSVHHLPVNGTIQIGRDSKSDLKLDHASVSRDHAMMEVGQDGIRVADLGSRNGTKVNGQSVNGWRLLSSGDVVGVGDIHLVVHVSNAPIVSRATYAEPAWRRRLAEELERALTYHRPLSVLALAGVTPLTVAKVGESLRLIDVVGEGADDTVLVLMPESDRDQATVTASRMLAALRIGTPEIRGGLASCPTDATDVDSIVLAARKALRRAGAGAFVEVSAAATTIELGERRVLVLDPAMSRSYEMIERMARSQLPVLITGETGTGKENAAYAVHHWSKRTGRFVTVNCSTLESLAESQLFGHEKGAFTGATSTQIGLFESADGGTVFLDEIGDLPPAIQVKLLRVLQEKKITRLGDTRERTVDVRVVAATWKNLPEEVVAGRFREDLLYRIRGVPVFLPPLRDRRCEIPTLARAFLAEFCGASSKEITPQAMQVLLGYHWPGNVRELRTAMEFAAMMAPDDRVESGDLPPEILGATTPAAAPSNSAEMPAVSLESIPATFRPLAEEIEELERTRIAQALAAADNKTKAAQLIGMPIRTFTHKLKHYKLS